MTETRNHGVVSMDGRDPHEPSRASTTLELLFDLTFVIAYGAAANELGHALAEGHVAGGIAGFCFAGFAIPWAWINFTWFASAYDTDDWVYRVTTMVQMVGVLIMALGMAPLFASLSHGLDSGHELDNAVVVLGYVVMRVPMIAQWLRARAQDPQRRQACTAYAVSLFLAQAGWVALIFLPLDVAPALILGALLMVVELGGPVVAETRFGGTPWHAHHIAERYGLLIIIALGEGMLGTMASLQTVVGPDGPGWSFDVALLALAGVALVFGIWWVYFVMPSGEVLHVNRERSFGWGYGHIPVFSAVVAVGAGLHVGAYYLGGESGLSEFQTVLVPAIPLSIFIVGVFWLYSLLTRSMDPFHLVLLALSAVCVAGSLALAAAGVPLPWALLVLALTPWVTVVGYETVGHRHHAEAVEAAR